MPKRVTLRYFDGCPHWRVAEDRLREATDRLGRGEDVELVHERVEGPEEAEALGFQGSPTILVDGRDPFPSTAPIGLSCRVYDTEAGREGAPSVAQIIAALRVPEGT